MVNTPLFIVQKTTMEDFLIDQMNEIGEENGYPKDVVDKIAKVETDKSDKPIEPVVIENMEVVTYNK